MCIYLAFVCAECKMQCAPHDTKLYTTGHENYKKYLSDVMMEQQYLPLLKLSFLDCIYPTVCDVRDRIRKPYN